MHNYMKNMQNMHKNVHYNMWKICNVICEKYAEYALKYAKYVKYTGKCDMQRIRTKICKIAKYVNKNAKCRICTPHFADVTANY